MNKQPRIGLVLSSGGSRGVYAHTGFLLALERMGIPVAAVAGCSAGAVVGGIYASGSELGQWSDTLADLDPRSFWKPECWPCSVWKIAAKNGKGFIGVSGTDMAVEFCRDHLTAQTFEECKMPFYALAICLGSGEKVVFSAGELAPRMVASAAIPLLYQPVEIDGDLYCDGAVVELAPTDAICCKEGLDVLIVHHVAMRSSGYPSPLERVGSDWSMVDILDRLLFRHRPWYLSDETIVFRSCPCGCRALIVVIEPGLSELPWPQTSLGPTIQQQALEESRRALAPHIEALRSDLESLRSLVIPAPPGTMEASRC